MKPRPRRIVRILTAFLLIWSCLATRPAVAAVSELPDDVKLFIARKEAQAKELAKRFEVDVSPDIWRYFAAARKGDYPEVERLFEKLKKRQAQYEGSKADPTVTSEVWQPVLETQLACEQFAIGEPHYARAFGQDIIHSIPPGSIYFGGTDPGRGLVTTLCKSQETGEPFFTITQNALADMLYLHYIDVIYGKKIYVPGTNDSQTAFQTYLKDAQRRMNDGKLKPGEDVRIVNDRVQVSGQVAVMMINGLLAKVIFENNPKREFFIEESFPLDWMYPHLTPHGLIMQINRQPFSTLSDEVVEKDQKYWSDRIKPMLGDWLQPGTSVKELCDFATRIFAQKDLAGFKGDPKYVTNTNACSMFSKLRSSIGGVYAWRAADAKDPTEKKRMVDAADFAFRQAYALCPYSPEAVFRYVNLLTERTRGEEALQIARTTLKITPHNDQVTTLVRQLEEIRKGKHEN